MNNKVETWFPPLIYPEKENDSECKFNPQIDFWDFSMAKSLKVEKEVEVNNKNKMLHDGWAAVMREEAKNHLPNFKPDPNISQEFFDKLVDISKDLKLNPEDLAAVIYLESHFDPQIKGGDYYGLIQMNKTTYEHIFPKDIPFDKYKALPREKQLKYVEGYIKYRIKEKGFENKEISGGLLRALIKRPKDVHNKVFIDKCQKVVDKIKQKPYKYLNSINTKI